MYLGITALLAVERYISNNIQGKQKVSPSWQSTCISVQADQIIIIIFSEKIEK